MPSPFLTPGETALADNVALLHLRRDDSMPTVLRAFDDKNEGYKEGKVSNTRFGSFPHSTLIGQKWGSQIAASKVDTGSRGRKPTKRKAEELDASTGADEDSVSTKTPVTASSGFLHLMYPTPESWTLSLPHRTQVVYTPDYSYILHRLRARPGSTVIEAGAGSGSFTHASVRAVFNGYPGEEPATKKQRLGKVCSYEFHEQRAGRVREEITEHGLDGLVEVTHRDVYEDGFLLGDPQTGRSPKASAIFLDLPAPWLALKHLVRHPASGAESPLDPNATAYICTFSPCLEQAEKTIRMMRKLSWLNISMVEVQHNRIEVKRERIGLDCDGIRGATVFPKTVDEAANKLREDDARAKRFRLGRTEDKEASAKEKEASSVQEPAGPLYSVGRLVHRSENELKTHTSYLVFAILPREWTEEDEQRCRQKYPSDKADNNDRLPTGKSRKQMKREFKELRLKEAADEKAKAQQPTEETSEA